MLVGMQKHNHTHCVHAVLLSILFWFTSFTHAYAISIGGCILLIDDKTRRLRQRSLLEKWENVCSVLYVLQGGRDRGQGRGRGRGRRGRRGYDDEEEAGMTLDEYEAMQRKPGTAAMTPAGPHPFGSISVLRDVHDCQRIINDLVIA